MDWSKCGGIYLTGVGKGIRKETYAGGRGESVLDYVIGDEEVWERVERDKLGEKIESYHFPVWIKERGEIIRRKGSRRRKK